MAVGDLLIGYPQAVGYAISKPGEHRQMAVQLSLKRMVGLTREWLELLPAEPWLLVSISAPASKCACAAARTLASQAMGEECPELSLPLRPHTALSQPFAGTSVWASPSGIEFKAHSVYCYSSLN